MGEQAIKFDTSNSPSEKLRWDIEDDQRLNHYLNALKFVQSQGKYHSSRLALFGAGLIVIFSILSVSIGVQAAIVVCFILFVGFMVLLSKNKEGRESIQQINEMRALSSKIEQNLFRQMAWDKSPSMHFVNSSPHILNSLVKFDLTPRDTQSDGSNSFVAGVIEGKAFCSCFPKTSSTFLNFDRSSGKQKRRTEYYFNQLVCFVECDYSELERVTLAPSSIKNTILGGKDLEILDTQFDKAFHIEGTDYRQFREFFSRERRQRLLKIRTDFPDVNFKMIFLKGECVIVFEKYPNIFSLGSNENLWNKECESYSRYILLIESFVKAL